MKIIKATLIVSTEGIIIQLFPSSISDMETLEKIGLEHAGDKIEMDCNDEYQITLEVC